MVIIEFARLDIDQQDSDNSSASNCKQCYTNEVQLSSILQVRRFIPAEQEQGSVASDSREGYPGTSPQATFLQKDLNIQTVGNIKCEKDNQNSSSIVKLREKYYKPEKCEEQSVELHSILCFMSLFTTAPHSMLKTLTLRHLLSLIVMFIRFLYMGCCCMGTDSPSKKHLLVSLLLLANIVGQSKGGNVIETEQRLPVACLSSIEEFDCAIREELGPQDNTWENLSVSCCSGYPGTVLQCQRNGVTNFPACLPDESVEAGFIAFLMKDEENNPKLVAKRCDNTTFEGHERNSSYITYPYCLQKKSKCLGEGEVVLCHGGTTEDDLCTCAPGYVAQGGIHCENGFSDDHDCWCGKMICPGGQTPVGTQPNPDNYSCVDMRREGFIVKASCETLSPVTSPPTLNITSPVTRGSSLSLATYMSTFPTIKKANGDPDCGTDYTVIAILVSLCIIQAIVILVLCLKDKIRHFRTNRAPTSPAHDPNFHSQQPLVV